MPKEDHSMKNLTLFLIFALMPYRSLAVVFQVEEPCSGHIVRSQIVPNYRGDLGSLTIEQLELWGVDFIGNEVGIHTILGTPVGDEALEIINNLEMRSYGWCYAVDGKIPEVLPPYFEITANTKKVTWFFGFAHYKAGEWVSQCEKVSKVKPPFICLK